MSMRRLPLSMKRLEATMNTEHTEPSDRFTRTRDRIEACALEMGYTLTATEVDTFAVILLAMVSDARALVAAKLGAQTAKTAADADLPNASETATKEKTLLPLSVGIDAPADRADAANTPK